MVGLSREAGFKYGVTTLSFFFKILMAASILCAYRERPLFVLVYFLLLLFGLVKVTKLFGFELRNSFDCGLALKYNISQP